ncbi:MAG: hypothetical protein RIR97_1444 [Pseudomonadota bacterium]
MTPVTRRLVLHFAGFEPVDAEGHRKRYERASRQSGEAFGISIKTGPFTASDQFPDFNVEGQGPNWSVTTRFVVFDHSDFVASLRAISYPAQVFRGYQAMTRIIMEGGLVGYMAQAWRFGLFVLFPYLLTLSLCLLTAVLAMIPLLAGLPNWHLIWTVPLALLCFRFVFYPFSERYLTLHIYADWRMAVHVARLDDHNLRLWLDAACNRVKSLINEPFDEIVVTGHSMGASMAAEVIGRALEENPKIFSGKQVVFMMLGGTILQCALLKSGGHLRRMVALIAQCPDVTWVDVQCLTDIIHFYKTKTVAACGYPDLPQARLLFVRFKTMLMADHYKKIKSDFLRVHRQYVLGSDTRSKFDFALMTAGPIPAADFAGFANADDVPIAADGSLIR